MPPGGTWYPYEFPTDQFLTGMRYYSHTNAAGFRIPMTLQIYQSSEFIVFNNFGVDAMQEIVIIIGEPANVYDVSWSMMTEDPNCETDTTGWYVEFKGLSTV